MKRVLILSFILTTSLTFAQETLEQSRAKLYDLFYYLDIEKSVSEPTMDSLALALNLAEKQGESIANRTKNWGTILNTIFDLVGDPDLAYQKKWLNQYNYPRFSAFFNTKIAAYDWNESNTTKSNELGEVSKQGTGPETLILIPPTGFDWKIFQPFINLNKERYTIYAITLPGFGGTPPYLRDKKRDLANMSWFKNIDNALLGLLRAEGIEKAFIAGNGLGGFIAAQFGLKHPEMTKGVIAINGTINVPMAQLESNKAASLSDRRNRVKNTFPDAELRPFPTFQPTGSFQSHHSNQPEPIRAIVKNNLEKVDRYTFWMYRDQMKAADLMEELKSLKVPLLSITSVHDPLSRFVTGSRANVIAWQKLKLALPDKPIHLVPIQNARGLVLFDYPKEAGKLIHQFTAVPNEFEYDKPKPTHAVNISPKSTISQTFSNIDVSITYSRPAVKGRKIFGSVVPYGKVWRAGANEATEISFSRDVLINNERIKAGNYSLFVEPHEKRWTLILNQIVNQWGVFNYEQSHDVIRFDIVPETVSHQEYLKYDLEQTSQHELNLSLQWDSLRVSVPILETFKPALVPRAIQQFAWQKLLEDEEGDVRNKNSSDGKAFSYYHDVKTDSIWFKLETYNPITTINPAISVSIDHDNNQSNGALWYGTNRQFKVDLMLSAGPVRQGDGYDGYNGTTDAKGIQTSDWINVDINNVTFYFGVAERAYYLGVKRTDISPQLSKFNVIGSVGANSTWNDDIGKDGEFATITLKN